MFPRLSISISNFLKLLYKLVVGKKQDSDDEQIAINKSVYTPLSENKEKRAEIVWFGFVSERSFRLKTTLHKGGGLSVNG